MKTYNEFINDIINDRGQWGIDDSEYFEAHHIVPKCCGGEPIGRYNKRDHHPNLIRLKPEEHYEAHRLLALENPDNSDLQLAWMFTVNTARGYVSPEMYAELKNNHFKFSDEHKANISLHHADFSGENNPRYGKGYLIAGDKNPMYGKHHSDSTKRAIGEKSSKWQSEHPGESFSKIKKWREENPDKFSKSQSRPGGKNGRALKVVCVETGGEFECINYAKQWLKSMGCRDYKHIGSCCKGKRDTAGGYHWKYAD